MQTWIFQGNPDQFDLDAYLGTSPTQLPWLVTRYAQQIFHHNIRRCLVLVVVVSEVSSRTGLVPLLLALLPHRRARRFFALSHVVDIPLR